MARAWTSTEAQSYPLMETCRHQEMEMMEMEMEMMEMEMEMEMMEMEMRCREIDALEGQASGRRA